MKEPDKFPIWILKRMCAAVAYGWERIGFHERRWFKSWVERLPDGE